MQRTRETCSPINKLFCWIAERSLKEKDDRIRELEKEKEGFVKSLIAAGEECLGTLKDIVADPPKED